MLNGRIRGRPLCRAHDREQFNIFEPLFFSQTDIFFKRQPPIFFWNGLMKENFVTDHIPLNNKDPEFFDHVDSPINISLNISF